jgi:hypothetical protein
MLRLEGSMSVGHSASRKFGGPEMYNVPMRAFSAGEENGKSKPKDFWRRDGVEDVSDALWAERSRRRGHSYDMS